MIVWFVLFVVIAVLLTVLYWGTNLGNHTKFTNYIAVLALLGTLVTVLTLLANVKLQSKKLGHQERSHGLSCAIKYKINLEKFFIAQYPYLENLYGELYPHQSPRPITHEIRQQGHETKQQAIEAHTCMILLETVQSVSLSDAAGNDEWMALFQSWFQSKRLQQAFRENQQLFTESTRKLISGICCLPCSSNHSII
jgi:hypothetical protein